VSPSAVSRSGPNRSAEPGAVAEDPSDSSASPFGKGGGGLGVRLRGVRGLWRPYPVEYKRGQKKRGNFDRVQLCAQALCLEEMLTVCIADGALFYGRTRRREIVTFDHALRDETERLATRMHTLHREGRTPVVPYDSKRCDRCSLIGRCIPKTTGAAPSVEKYIRLALAG